MFRERMRVGVSKAEIRIATRLQREGYAQHMVTQEGHKLHSYFDKVQGTRTDIEYLSPYNLCIYIDCLQIHLKRRQEKRDELITLALLKRGYTVKRYQYTYPLTKKRETEIVEDIEQWLREHGYTPTN